MKVACKRQEITSAIIVDSSLQNSALRKTFGAKRKALVGKIQSFMMRTILISAAAKYHSSDPIKEGGMGGARGTHMQEEKYLQAFDGETRKELTVW
jgi:hypothetical protein